jgi:hypothetical protein
MNRSNGTYSETTCRLSVSEPLPLLLSTFQLLRSKFRHSGAVVPVHKQFGQCVNLDNISPEANK